MIKSLLKQAIPVSMKNPLTIQEGKIGREAPQKDHNDDLVTKITEQEMLQI